VLIDGVLPDVDKGWANIGESSLRDAGTWCTMVDVKGTEQLTKETNNDYYKQ
jgi:hypothetical protein